ncbi:MAG: adenylate/guanylate cyclase domain-containing protein [Rhodospirillaceae bacterium]|nr:adenylate/guanylate cyclase domain-containing protein [Rhodospirillaceae bacterium]
MSFATAVLLGLGFFSAALAAGFLVGYWINARETAQDAGRALFLERQANVTARLNALFDGPQFVAANLAQNPLLRDGRLQDLERALLSAIEFHPWIVNIKIGVASGLYFSVSQIAPVPDTRYYTPPPGARYAIVTVAPDGAGGFAQHVKFRDRDLALMDTVVDSPSTTDVRKLDWYTLGQERGGELAWMGRVVPGGVGARISFVVGFFGQTSGTLGIDIGHRDASAVLQEVRGASDEHLMVFDAEGIRYGTTNARYDDGDESVDDELPRRLEDEIEGAFVAQYAARGAFSGRIVPIGGEDFFMSVAPIALREQMGVALLAGVATPLSRLEAPLRENLTGVLGLIALMLLLSVPFVYFIARKVSEPLATLSALADDTLKLRFDARAQVDSTIREVRELVNSFRRAQVAFRNICRFVPEAHVRRTIESGAAEVFGERRTVSLLMTDVTDFTTMAERLPPEGLLADMSEYFDRMNREILAEGGTIDKYVGDAIFSYWNGVTDQADHAERCCRAALRVRGASRLLAATWRAAGKWPWATRVGLHRGDVVVGNIGSDTRMDFTVIGNAVNLASRIEGLNKVYGTEILASDDIRRDSGEAFLFRSVDVIRPKGIATPLEIHELVGLHAELDAAAAEACARWNEAFILYRARAFDEALAGFRALAAARPHDGLARLYVSRCERLVAAPPPADWDGVETFSEK